MKEGTRELNFVSNYNIAGKNRIITVCIFQLRKKLHFVQLIMDSYS